MLPIAKFDILDPDWTTKLVLNFDMERHESLEGDILDQMQDLGYETHNSVLNLGSLAIFLTLYFAQLGAFLLVKGFSLISGKGADFARKLKRGLFFGEIIALLIDAYFEFIISGYLQAQHPLFT